MKASQQRYAGEGRHWTHWIVFAVLIVISGVYIYPFVVQVINSFKTNVEATNAGMSLLPTTWTTAAYQTLFAHSDFPRWFMNSVIVTICVTIGRVFFNSLAGYALARLRFVGRATLFALVVGVMPTGPAAQAGLTTGSTITALGNDPIGASADLSEVLATHTPGQVVSLTWTDPAGTAHTAKITLAEAPLP